MYTFTVIFPLPSTVTFNFSVSLETFWLYTLSEPTITVIFTLLDVVVVLSSSSSLDFGRCLFANAFTFILTVPCLFFSILLTVIVIADPSSTDVPGSTLCFNTTPSLFDVSSSSTTFTSNFKSVNIFLASSLLFPITDVTVTFLIPVPVLTCIFIFVPFCTSVLASIS